MAEYTGPDRRNRPTPVLSRYSFFGGRRGIGGQSGSSYYDRYPTCAWVVLTSFLLLNILDAHFTLIYIQRGGEEANPIAAGLLDIGMWSFIGIKAFGVGLGAVIFCILNDFKNARIGVFAALVFYQLLFFYHLSLYLGWVGNVSY